MKILHRLAIVAALLFAGAAFAQEQAAPAPKPQEVVVRIQQDAPPAPKAAPTVAQKANEWVDVGTNLGTAFGAAAKSILHETRDATFGKDVSLVDGIDKFSRTDAGRFTMLMVGWKIMGKDAVELVDRVKKVAIGVPFLIGWACLFIWFYRRNFMAYSVRTGSTGNFWNKQHTYKVVNEDTSWSDGKCAGAVVSGLIFAAITLGVAINVIF
jgi:hypothetical protein